MKVAEAVMRYIEFKRSLGMRFNTERIILRAFAREIGDVELAAVGNEQVVQFLRGTGAVTSFFHRKQTALNGFYRFAIGRSFTSASPMPVDAPKLPPPIPAFIYSTEQIHMLLVTTGTHSSRSVLDPDTFRHLLLVLFGTGLRLGEALRLRLVDVDLVGNVLTVHESKFYRSRLVPINLRLSEELRAYARRRRERPCVHGESSTFFATRSGSGISISTAERRFRKLCEDAGIARDGGARWQPRFHDARHTFALNRLVTWYREKQDVQRLLPHLSTYLGHVDIKATQRYLSATPELLREANSRFEIYANTREEHEKQ